MHLDKAPVGSMWSNQYVLLKSKGRIRVYRMKDNSWFNTDPSNWIRPDHWVPKEFIVNEKVVHDPNS